MAEVETAKQCAAMMRANDRASSMLGISVDVVETGRAKATMTVRDDMVNGFDVCHGGLLFTLADTAFAFACNTYDAMSFAASSVYCESCFGSRTVVSACRLAMK